MPFFYEKKEFSKIKMIEEIKNIIKEAGQIVLSYYGKSCSINAKEDKSPLTQADMASHNFLCAALKQIKNIPILSEENIIPYNLRKNWTEFWLIDPLDGTKEFINNYSEFCVLITLIQNGSPALGVIYAPALDELYSAEKGSSFTYSGPKRNHQVNNKLITAVSRFHNSDKTLEFIKMNKLVETIKIGSALKFGRMALGEIDLYPRFEGSKEWDIAAGQIILQEANCDIIDLTSNKAPKYNKINLQNNSFIAYGPKINFCTLQFL